MNYLQEQQYKIAYQYLNKYGKIISQFYPDYWEIQGYYISNNRKHKINFICSDDPESKKKTIINIYKQVKGRF